MNVEVAIVGGGPAGLAVAIEAAARGISVALFERQALPPDKACGEGLLPRGVGHLRRLGLLERIPASDRSAISGIRYLQEDGTTIEAPLPGEGFGVRRTALEVALASRAAEAGALLHFGCAVRRHQVTGQRVVLDTDAGEVRARLLVAADGANSPVRRAAGIAERQPRYQRFGLRRHFALSPWTSHVEVHWADGIEAYVTPAGDSRVGVAFLWHRDRLERPRVETLLEHFPALRERLAGAAFDSAVRGAGPFGATAARVIAPRTILIGDSAGTLDPITGEGVSLALECSAVLGELLPRLVSPSEPAPALQDYAAAHRREFSRASLLSRSLLQLSANPRLRRSAFRTLARAPAAFRSLLGWSVGRGKNADSRPMGAVTSAAPDR